MNFSGHILRSFVVVLISAFLALTDVYALENKTQQKAEKNKEKIISILQSGISLIKYEIQRDRAVASNKMLLRTLRKLRITLKNDIGAKEKLINDMLSLVSSELSGEIGLLRTTFEQEKTIIKSVQTSKRARRVTKNTIKGFIPIKEQILASFENFYQNINEISVKP